MKKGFPLVVDLDGTLLQTDLLYESSLRLLKRRPLTLLAFPFWLLRGIANLKHKVAVYSGINATLLPFNKPFLDFLKKEHKRGRSLILATAANKKFAEEIADHLGIFSKWIASDSRTNIKGKKKRDAVKKYLGHENYDYAGDSTDDIPLLKKARETYLVNPSTALLMKKSAFKTPVRIFKTKKNPFSVFLRAIRFHQITKNLLIFVPVITAHEAGNMAVVTTAFLAYLAFSFCSFGTYLINDIFDLEADRRHPIKKDRPLAAGELSVLGCLVFAFLLLGSSAYIAFQLPVNFRVVLLIYFTTALFYSLFFKKIVVADVLLLAGLYVLRIIAGCAATFIPYSSWLLAFSLFFFLSLAFLKRHAELVGHGNQKRAAANRRGYLPVDLSQVRTLGISSGYISVLIFALYINSQKVLLLYQNPAFLWSICPCLLFWISRVWIVSGRGEMNEDPILFTLKDIPSLVTGAITLAFVFIAS